MSHLLHRYDNENFNLLTWVVPCGQSYYFDDTESTSQVITDHLDVHLISCEDKRCATLRGET